MKKPPHLYGKRQEKNCQTTASSVTEGSDSVAISMKLPGNINEIAQQNH
jgi:hypothetical protein